MFSLFKASHWFHCECSACIGDYNTFERLARDYVKLPGAHFRYKRCNRKELQKDVEKMKKRIKYAVCTNNDLENAMTFYCQWATLLQELLIPPHQDFVNVRRGLRNCVWLRSPNVCKVREDQELKDKKAKYKEKVKAR